MEQKRPYWLSWVVVAMVGQASLLLAWSLVFYHSRTDAVSHGREVLERVQTLRMLLEEMETGQRGYLITGAERYLEPYREARVKVTPALTALRQMAAGSSNLGQQVDRLTTAIEEKTSELEETIRLRRQKAGEAARAIVLTDRGKRSMDVIRNTVAQIEFDQEAKISAQFEKEERSRQATETGAFLSLMLGSILTVFGLWRSRWAELAASASETAKQEQEVEFRLLADSVVHLAWMANPDGWIFWYNRRWFEFTGTTPEKMEGWGWQSVHDPASLPQVLKMWRSSILKGETFEMEFPLRGVDGQFRLFLTCVVPLKDERGQVLRWFGTNTDITQRAEAARNTSRLAAIVESSGDAVIGKTLEGVIESWNSGAEKLYGYSRDEVLGRQMSLLLPAERANEEADILGRVGRGERVSTMETTRLTKNGQIVIVSLNVSPIKNSGGLIVGASHIARDITERKEFEIKMHEAQKLETLGVLAGGIAHDFNNLLTGVLGNASLAIEAFPVGDPARHFLNEVIVAAERASALTHQLLAYAGKGKFFIEPVDLSTLASEISRLVEASIPRKVRLQLELDPNLPLIEGDASQLQQVVMNLVINGAEAIGEETGTVVLKTWCQMADEEYLRSVFADSSLSPGRYVSLEVSDTGSGMTSDTLAKIFDPFFTTKFTGRGLGLAAVQGIIRSHHGVLKVESSPGHGTRFRLLLPTSEKPVAFSTPTQLNVDLLHGKGHVLIVEDDQTIRAFAQSALEQYGYLTTPACNGQQAVDIFSRTPAAFDAVFLDLTLPIMNGEEVFQRIRKIRPGIPVVLTSGYSSSTALDQFYGDALPGFLEKPYTSKQMLEKIKAAGKS